MNISDEVKTEAAKSKCRKRKVGAIIVNSEQEIIKRGHNYRPMYGICEDENGNTHKDVVHAEVNAIDGSKFSCGCIMYVSHPPCNACSKAIELAGITEVRVIEDFMKFDAGKLRYDRIPPSSLKGLARVLTYGAKKYKPNNWKNVDNLDRYVAALYRHLEEWRSGSKVDQESGLKHLEHAMTNLCFLLELDTDEISADLSKVLDDKKTI